MNEIIPPPEYDSPQWSRTTKTIVAVVTLLLAAAIAYRFQSLIAQIVVAAMLAYIFNPLIALLDRRTGLSRTAAILIVYLLLALTVLGALTALGVAAYDQVTSFIAQVPRLIASVTAMIEEIAARTEPFYIGPFAINPSTLNWNAITNQALSLVEPLAASGGQFVRQLAATTVRWVGYMLFVFVLSVYFANDIPRLGGYIVAFAYQPGYHQDVERLLREFGRIWSAYLRGQVILGVIIGFSVWLGLSILGVQNALALGLLSGLLEFIPILGPVIGAAAAILVAFFQPDNYLGLPAWQYALTVLVLVLLIQQLESNILVPRIVGEALDLHPLIVILGVFMGGSLAGILGAILAAPVVASLKLLGIYAWRKMFDLPPFPDPEEDSPPPKFSLLERGRILWVRIRPPRPPEESVVDE